MVYETVTTPTNKNLSVRVCCVVTDDVKHLTRCILNTKSLHFKDVSNYRYQLWGGFLNYEKLVTITTLTAGIGASLGTTSNAHAEENTQNIQNNAHTTLVINNLIVLKLHQCLLLQVTYIQQANVLGTCSIKWEDKLVQHGKC